MRTIALAARLAAAPIACSHPVAADASAAVVAGDEPIRTDRAEYVADRSGGGVSLDIPIRFVNPTQGPVWVSTCHSVYPPVLEKLVAGAWEKAYNEPVLLCLGVPIVIQAGGTYDYTFRIRAAAPGTNTYPQFEQPSVPGTYRLVWAVYEGDGSDLAREVAPRMLPLDQRVSNSFRITER
jgi:hypothetical protein